MTAYPRDGNQIPCVQTTPPSAYPTHELPPTGGVSPQAPTLSSTLLDPPLLSEPSPGGVVEAPAPLPWPRLQLLTRPAALPLTYPTSPPFWLIHACLWTGLPNEPSSGSLGQPLPTCAPPSWLSPGIAPTPLTSWGQFSQELPRAELKTPSAADMVAR